MAITWGVLAFSEPTEAEAAARSLFAENVVSSFGVLVGDELFMFGGNEQGDAPPYPWIDWELDREPAPAVAAALRALRCPDATHDDLDRLIGIRDIFAMDAEFRELERPVLDRYRCVAGLDGLVSHLEALQDQPGPLQELARHFLAAARFARRHDMLLVVNR